jgi:teichoic acid transport system permease protein
LSTETPTYTEHVYERQRAHGTPPLRRYLRRVWQGRGYMYFRTRAELKAQHFNSFLGQIWMLLNPLLLAAVYWLLFTVVRGSRGFDFLVFLVAGLFLFQYTSESGRLGMRSVTGGGSLIANTNMARALLPISSVLSAFSAFLPMLVVYAAFHVSAGLPVGRELLALPVIVLIQTVFNIGLAMLLATLNVYFRDLDNFRPYLFRIWMYMSPVLYRFQEVRESAPEPVMQLLRLNPMAPMLEGWHLILSDGVWPYPRLLITSSLWAVGLLVVGGWLFLSREREFAVRL